jgi:serine/threonine protein kinase
MIGSWHYMAPERLSGNDPGAHSDVYSLACVLFECLTGTRPFPGDSLESQVGGHMMTTPPRPAAVRPTVPAAFDAVIATGMSPTELRSTTLTLIYSTVSLPSWSAGSRQVSCNIGATLGNGGWSVLLNSAKGPLLINGQPPMPPP